MKVLVLDDEERICNVLKSMLTDLGHTVVAVEQGSHALNLLKMNVFDVLILDILMDEIVGTDVIKKLREMKCGVKIIVLTSVDDEGVKKYVRNMDVKDYFVKPYNLEKIKNTLDRTITALCSTA